MYGGARRWLGALGTQQAQAWAGVGASRALGAGRRRAWLACRRERACGRRWACVGARASAAGARASAAGARAQGGSGRRSALQAGLAAAARRARDRLGKRQQGARGPQATGGRPASKHGVGEQGRAAGRRVRAGHGRPGRGLGAGGWQTGPAGPVLVHCAPGSVLARLLDPVRLGIFLSHQMNIVHYKINFFFFRKKK